MKIYVKSDSNNTNTVTFEVIMELHASENIAAAFHPNCSDDELNLEIEDTLEQHYDNFINNLYRKLEDIGFEHIEPVRKSNNPNSKSRYFTFCKKDEYDTLTVELIIYLRVSDHRLTKRKGDNKTWDRHKATTEFHRQELENYKCLNDTNPNDMDIYELSIIVNNHKFRTYREACQHILNRVKELSK